MRSRGLALSVLVMISGSGAAAGELVVNDVAIGRVELTVRGLEGVQLEKCASLRIGSNGDVRVSCPGYNLRSSGVKPAPSESDAPPTRIAQRYWLVTEAARGASPVDVELYLNGRLVRVKASEGPRTLDVTDRLVPGRNTVVVGARRSATVRAVEGAQVHVRLGAGEQRAAGVHLDEPVLDVKLGEADTAGAPRALDFVAR